MGMTPDASVIQAIWDALLNAEKPLLVSGPDIAAAGAEHEILALAERLALPVATGMFDYLGDPEIDFVMLARAQGIEGAAVREPQAIEAALRRGVDAMNAGEPYLLDIRVAAVSAGAESTWHQRFKLRE